MRKALMIFFVSLSILVAAPAAWATGFDTSTGKFVTKPTVNPGIVHSLINVDGWGLALEGWDPVSFHHGRPREGKARFSVQYNGAVYHFINVENRNVFLGDPGRYAPMFGGFCAWGVADPVAPHLSHGSPHYWRIVDGRLYVVLSAGVLERWDKDRDAAIERGKAGFAMLQQNPELWGDVASRIRAARRARQNQ